MDFTVNDFPTLMANMVILFQAFVKFAEILFVYGGIPFVVLMGVVLVLRKRNAKFR